MLVQCARRTKLHKGVTLMSLQMHGFSLGYIMELADLKYNSHTFLSFIDVFLKRKKKSNVRTFCVNIYFKI